MGIAGSVSAKFNDVASLPLINKLPYLDKINQSQVDIVKSCEKNKEALEEGFTAFLNSCDEDCEAAADVILNLLSPENIGK